MDVNAVTGMRMYVLFLFLESLQTGRDTMDNPEILLIFFSIATILYSRKAQKNTVGIVQYT